MTYQSQEEVEKEFIEKGAALEHERWSGWQSYLHTKCIKNDDGSLTIPPELVSHWDRQINTNYEFLSEGEKESDRKEVRNYLPLISKIRQNDLKSHIEKLKEEMTYWDKLPNLEGKIKSGASVALKYIQSYLTSLIREEA